VFKNILFAFKISKADDDSIQFNSIIYYLCAESTALRPITNTAQSTCKYMLIEKYEQKTKKQTNKQTN
jgi:hypothetical protein